MDILPAYLNDNKRFTIVAKKAMLKGGQLRIFFYFLVKLYGWKILCWTTVCKCTIMHGGKSIIIDAVNIMG